MKAKLTKALVLLLTIAMVATQIMVPVFAVDTVKMCECDVSTRTGTLVTIIPATCVGYGYLDYECDECGGIYIVLNGAALGHTPGDEVIENKVDATCAAEGGYDTVVYCTVCGDKVSSVHTDIEQLEHDWKRIAGKGKTCLENGLAAHWKCNACGAEDSNINTPELDAVRVIGAKGAHTFPKTGVVTAPTCTEKGYTTYVCTFSNCDTAGGEVLITEYTDPTGHTAGDVVIENNVEATCTAAGSYDEVVYCVTCDEELSREDNVVPMNAHEWQETSRVDKVYCTDTAKVDYKCADCEATKQDVVDPANHNYDIEITGADCSKPGTVTYTCKVCAYSIVDKTQDALPHTEGEPVIENNVDPDCVNEGSYDTVIYCTVCGNEVSRVKTTVEALGHTEDEAVVENRVEATCTAAGSYDTVVYCAVCGDELSRETKEISALGHDEISHDVKAPTCTEVGNEAYVTCSRCDYTTYVEIPENGHTLGDAVVVAPTCSAQGYTKQECSACAYVEKYDYVEIDSDAHKVVISENSVPATCVSKGWSYELGCELCGSVLTPKRETEINPNNHNMVHEVTDPTCLDEGYTTHYCANECGLTETVDTYVPGLGHTPADADKECVLEATCTVDGSYDSVVYCFVCGEELSRVQETITAQGHILENIDAKASTCTDIGWEAYEECSVCDYTTYVEIPANGHDGLVVVTPPTCVDEGYITFTCAVCGYEEICDTTSATGHLTTITIGDVDPTCVANGYTIEQCVDCGETFHSNQHLDENQPIGHDLVSTLAKAPTCTEIGWDEYVTCQRAQCTYEEVKDADGNGTGVWEWTTYTTYVEIPALGHDMFHHDAQAPTCTEIGWDEYDECSRVDECGETTYVELSALGHTKGAAVVENNVDPDCENKGSYDSVVYCTVCDEELSRVETIVPANGHTESTAVVENNVDPDCENTGSYDTVVYCTVCDKELSRVETIVPANGHTEGAAVVENNVDPDCENTGSYDTVVYCTVCDKELSRVETIVPANGHTEGAAVVENNIDPDCENKGSYDTVVYCTVCDKELSRRETIVPANGHTESEVEIENVVEPTYDANGSHDEVVYCTVCDKELSRVNVVDPVLDEAITFTYKATGINGSEVAVNSGKITLEVYMNVNTDVARLYGVDLGISFNDNLTLVSVDGCIFEASDYYNLDEANDKNLAQLTQDMASSADKTFEKGEHLFAILTFEVADYYYYTETLFEVVTDECEFARGYKAEYINELTVDYGVGTSITVVMLGDSDGDGKHTVKDTMALSQWTDTSSEYNTIYDMDKDGYITMADLALIRAAAAGNETYLNY